MTGSTAALPRAECSHHELAHRRPPGWWFADHASGLTALHSAVDNRCVPDRPGARGSVFWTDEGGAPEDSIHLYDLAWDQWPEQQKMHALMEEAVIMIERHIIGMA